MNLLIVFFICGFVAIGFSLTYVTGTPLRLEERLCFGVVIGTVVVSLLGFGVAWLVGVNGLMVLITFALGFAGAGPLLFSNIGGIKYDVVDFRRRASLPFMNGESPKPIFGLLAISSVISIRIMQNAFGETQDGGISAGHLSVYGDWSAHLSYAASFAYADNFPPDLPTAAGESFSYHFGVDWFSSMFIPLGSSLLGALEVSTAVLAIVFPPIMFIACEKLCSNRLSAAFAVLVFTTAGGTSALYRFFVEDIPDHGLSVLGNLPRSYAFDGFDRNWVDNPVTGFLYPQRPSLIGFSSVLIVLMLLWMNKEKKSPRTYLFAGVITGLLPVFHVFAFGAIVLVALGWLVLERRKTWIYFFMPSTLLGLPVLIWQLPQRDGHEWHFFWMLGKSSWERTPVDFVHFWFLNTGVFIPLAMVGTWVTFKRFGYRFFPIYAFLIIPNIAIWHFWPGNNAKYVVLYLLLAAPLVGETLSRLFLFSNMGKFFSVILVITLSLSGTLDIWRAFEGSSDPYPVHYLSGSDVLVGEWVRDNTDPDAIFASANTNVHPVRALAGRSVVSGFPGRLNDLGVNWYARDQDLRTLYEDKEKSGEIIHRYSIDYIVLGPYERNLFSINDFSGIDGGNSYSDRFGTLVYDIGDYQIYKTLKEYDK
ncbi:MAG: hypothetical protein CL470_02150 [Acidimicrobiaceae bacterium]|nr:hypothetical protein [Acidimicrobiaceae bacterium]